MTRSLIISVLLYAEYLPTFYFQRSSCRWNFLLKFLICFRESLLTVFERLHARVLNASKDASSVYILSDIAYELIYQVGEHPSCTTGEMGEAENSTEIDGALFLKIRSVCYLRPNAARKIAPTIIGNPAIVATKPNEIKNPPNGVLGPHGPKPDTNVSMNAATPMQKDIAPYFPSAFTYSCYQDRARVVSAAAQNCD